MLNLNEMAIFTQVVEAGSFTGAARALGLPKSTVSRKISQLEERLGVCLLQRTTRALKLTELGATYYEHCARIVIEAEEANLAVTQMQASPRGQLRITAPTEFGTRYLGAIITEYLQRYPEVRAEIELTDRVVDIIEEGFDLAIRGSVLADSTLIARKLASASDYLCASPAYLESRGLPQEPEDLIGHEFVIYPYFRGSNLKLVGPEGRRARVPVRGKLQANSLGLGRDAALSGLGVTLLPEWFCWEDLQSGRLKVVLGDWKLPGIGLYGVYPTPRHLSTKVKTFLDLLQKKLSPPPWQST